MKSKSFILIGSVAALQFLDGCVLLDLQQQRAHQKAMQQQMAQQQAENDDRQAEQWKKSFERSYETLENGYDSTRSRLELEEGDYQDFLSRAGSKQKGSPQCAALRKNHDELKVKLDQVVKEHAEIVEWYRATKDPTSEDNSKLQQTYSSLSQRQHLIYSNYGDLKGRYSRLLSRR